MKFYIILTVLLSLVILTTNYDSVFAMDMRSPHDEQMGKQGMMRQQMIGDSTGHHHMSFMGMCAPGFASLDGMCVLDDRCGPGVYPGRVCVMDGVMKQYLRPHHQKYAGISVDNIICAEGKELMFKGHNASPACVNSNSVEKLKHRGWQSEKPALVCTMEYNPVCGMDGITYGNPCMLHSEHMALKHQGECNIDCLANDQCVDDMLVDDPISQPECNINCLVYDPVCGVDGVTYGCGIEDAACHGVEVDYRGECQVLVDDTSDGIFDEVLMYTSEPPFLDEEKGYTVTEIASGVFWLVGSGYQTIFLTTGEGVVVVDAPKPIGEKYLEAISEVTKEPITHMIYSHPHQDHTGAAGEIFPENIDYIAHKDTADQLEEDNDPNRPIPNLTLEGGFNTMEIGNKTIEFYNIGDFHSKGNWLIILPQYKIAMLVDLLRPAESPYRAFGITPDIDLYLETHDTLQDFDFDVLITGHTGLLATKDHIQQNKQFTLDVMANAQDAIDEDADDPTQYCVNTTTKQWEDKLGNLDNFLADHCNAMLEYHASR